MSEIEGVSGAAGSFKVRVRRNPRYIREDICVGCMECVDACVYRHGKVPDEFNLGLSTRKPVYKPFAQAVPSSVVIDPEACLRVARGKCKQTCVAACERDAFAFDQKVEFVEVEVAAMILATGFKTFDPRRVPEYGYGRLPNVRTSLEVERLVNAAGPTGGEVLLENGERPRRVGIIHCLPVWSGAAAPVQ